MPVRKTIIIASTLFFLMLFLPMQAAFSQTASSSDDLATINKELADLNDQLTKSKAATKPLQSQLDSMQKQLASIRSQIAGVRADTIVKRKQIDVGYKDLVEKEKLISSTIRDFYIKSYYDTPLLLFFSADSASELTQSLAYQNAKTQRDKGIITNIALSITDLEKKKVELDQAEKFLVSAQASLDTKTKELDAVVQKSLEHQKTVSLQIATLSTKQQEIVTAKSGDFTFDVGDGELADEYMASVKAFRESAPAGSFGIFSFGAYTHRNGMSQYGAKARADSGQTVEDILKAYYPNATLKKDYAVMGSITVDGVGSIPFEDQYLQGIYEMPGSWHVTALKAQAIAARTYAIRRTDNGAKSICTTQSCQVFKNEKKGGAWEQAVNETKGWVLVDGGGNPVSTEYASTHGGFSKTSGWDTTDKNGGSNFIDRSYEKMGGSPWLYKAWWRQGTSNSGSTCGRSNPWLSSQEMADIVNAYLVITRGDGSEKAKVTPVTTACWGGSPYSMDELKSVASKYGGISSATSLSVSQGNGTTSNVTVNGISMSGSDFRDALNLRAPGYVSIPQSQSVYGAPFFNIEKK